MLRSPSLSSSRPSPRGMGTGPTSSRAQRSTLRFQARPSSKSGTRLIALEALRATYTDAMSEVAWAKYRAGECVSANTRAARAHHDDHGRPIAIFTDGATGSHFRVTVEQDESMEAHALLAELAWLTQRCKQRGLVLE